MALVKELDVWLAKQLMEIFRYQGTTCSLTGAPTPTRASCEMTITGRLGSSSHSTVHTIIVGDPDSTELMSIYPQHLTLATDAPTGSATASTGSASRADPAQTASPGTKTGNIARPTAVPPLVLAAGIAAGVVLA